MKKVRAGVVGVGHMGEYHVGVYSELFNVNLVGIADVDEARAKAVAEKYNTKYCLDYRELFGKVDCVSVSVPTSLHYRVAKDFLRNKINVLLEKPICHSLDEARELFHIAARSGVVLQIGHVERFNGAVQELKKIVRNPLLIECRRLGPFVPRIKDDGVILDVMIHDIDIVLSLVPSKVKEINALGASVFSDLEDIANVQLCFENGCVANIIASRATQHKVRTLAITQADAYILLDYTDQDIHIFRQASSEHLLTKEQLRYKQEALIERVFVHKDNPLKLEIKNMIDSSLNGSPDDASDEIELHSLEIALKIVESLKQQGVIKRK